jgi:hypothetical protein
MPLADVSAICGSEPEKHRFIILGEDNTVFEKPNIYGGAVVSKGY